MQERSAHATDVNRVSIQDPRRRQYPIGRPVCDGASVVSGESMTVDRTPIAVLMARRRRRRQYPTRRTRPVR